MALESDSQSVIRDGCIRVDVSEELEEAFGLAVVLTCRVVVVEKTRSRDS